MADEAANSRTSGLFSWINRHILSLSIALVVGAIVVARVGEVIADTDEPNFFFAAVVALLVLPSLLIVVAPRRKGEEREEMEAAVTGGEFEYDPHARETAIRTPSPKKPIDESAPPLAGT